jgi:hypothetical protein
MIKLAVVIPDRMSHLELDPRGYPIPWGVYRDDDGRPHFTINDESRRLKALARDLCPICGSKLFRGRWFVGGPMSAFHDAGAYIDAPMHHVCMEYALQVCPYLAAPSYGKRIDDKTLTTPLPVLLVDPTMMQHRPSVFVAVMATGQKLTNRASHVVPRRPYSRVEYWCEGKKLSTEEGERLVEQDKDTWQDRIKDRKTEPRIIGGKL